MSEIVVENPWQELRRFTPARIALGRTGDSLVTGSVLEFGLAHAQARDAVHAVFDKAAAGAALQREGFRTVDVESAAKDRRTYLQRPDLGRTLDAGSRARLLGAGLSAASSGLAAVVADGLSAAAVERYALPTLLALRERLAGWTLGTIILATQARVAIGDEIGEILGAEAVAVLIGERPGLSSPNSLGIYLTYQPRVGRADAERNCISNIHEQGLSPEAAARTLVSLLAGARRLKASGTLLHEEEWEPALPSATTPGLQS
jgi:ethanolamine ammonia-lyase small subunit